MIVIQKEIIDGKNKALITIDDQKGAIIKFTPSANGPFAIKVSKLVDEFRYNNEQGLSLEDFMIDTFERNKDDKES